MPSISIRERKTKDGRRRYLVEYRVGGRETKSQHGGSFRTKQLATVRAGWIAGELAAGRAPRAGDTCRRDAEGADFA